MSDAGPLTPEAEDDALAAEYALGLLEGDERDGAARRTRDEAGFAALVRGWQQRLARLAESLDPVTPPARVKQAVDRAIGGTAVRPAGGLVARGRLWLTGAIAAAAVAVGVLVLSPFATVGPPDSTAELVLPAEGARLLAAVDVDAGSLEVTLVSGTLPEAGDVELWWIAPGGAPVSLGLAPRSGSVQRDLPATLVGAGAEGVTIAASAEPAGGSPTGQPTGEVLTTAPLTTL